MIAGPGALAAWHPSFEKGGVPRVGRSLLILAGLSAILLVVALLAIAIGAVYIAPTAILGMALQWAPVHPTRTWSDADLAIITQIRLPRVLTAIMVGSALAAAGTAFQGLFRNPLADPGIIGASAGASLGAIVALLLPVQVAWLGFSLTPLAAFAGALGSMFLVYFLARIGGRLPSTTLLLAGFAVSAALNAVTSIMETLSDRLREMYTWLMGNLDLNVGESLLAATPLLVIGMAGLLALAGDMNVLLLGDEQSQYLGLRVTQRRVLILIFASLLTSVAVALGGLIVFVGLLAPHLTRLLFGANHRLLLPAAMLMGAIFLLVADLVARMALPGQELPVGLITALLGAPWFIILLRRKRGEYTF